MLYAQGDPDEVLFHPEARPARRGELPVRGRCRVYSQSVDVSEARGPDTQLQRVQETKSRFASRFGALHGELKGDKTAVAAQNAAGNLMVRMVLQAGLEHLRRLRVAGEVGGDLFGVLALALHTQGQRLEAPEGEPGLKRRHHAADELAQLLQRPVIGYVRDHDARGEVLGRTVYHDIRPELQRALQAGRAEGGVHDQGRAGGARNLRYARHVGHTQEGVGDGLYNDGPGLYLLNLSLDRRKVAGVDKACLGPARAEDLNQQRRGGTVELLGREDRRPVADLRRHERPVHGRHPRGEGERASPSLQACDRLLKGRDRGVAVAGVRVARLFAAQDPVGLLHVLVGKGRGEVDGGRDRVEVTVRATARGSGVLLPGSTLAGGAAFAGVDGAGLEAGRLVLPYLLRLSHVPYTTPQNGKSSANGRSIAWRTGLSTSSGCWRTNPTTRLVSWRLRTSTTRSSATKTRRRSSTATTLVRRSCKS